MTSQGELLTEIQTLQNQLSITRQRNRDLEADNAALAQRAALAVTQEAALKEVERIGEVARQLCYRCNHLAHKPDPDCPCCRNDHTPDADGKFPEAT